MKRFISVFILLLFLFCGCAKSQVNRRTLLSHKVKNKDTSDFDVTESCEGISVDDNISYSSSATESEKVNSTKTKANFFYQRTDDCSSKDMSPDTESDSSATIGERETIHNPETTAEEQYASNNCKLIAEKLIEYLNSYRIGQGIAPADVEKDLVPYAEYRSRQLISNFAHDTADERKAAKALEYGRYVDPADFGIAGEPYYTAEAAEAIVMAGYIGTDSEVAESIAQLIRGSPEHWIYVGSAEYRKIAVGVTYAGSLWFVDVAMKT